MRGPKPPVVELSSEEHQGLETLVRRYSTPQQLARRGRIILSAAAGLNNSQIAREVGLDVDTVRFWRNRWLGLPAASLEDLSLEERLRDAPRPGAPARITPEQVCQIIVRPQARAVFQSASGPAGNWLMRSSNKASWNGFPPAMRPDC